MGEFDQCLTVYETALRLLGEDTENSNFFVMTNDVARAYFKQNRNFECRYLCGTHLSILESRAESSTTFLMAYVQRLLLLGDLEAMEQNHFTSVELYRKASRATNGRNMIADVDRSIQEKLWHAVSKAERMQAAN